MVGLRHRCAVINGAKSALATGTYLFVQLTTTLVFGDGYQKAAKRNSVTSSAIN